MRLSKAGSVILSPSDLMRFQGCEHASSLDLEFLKGADLAPAPESEDAVLLQKKGHEHESAFLITYASQGKRVCSIETRGKSFEDAHAATLNAMREGRDVIYQGALKTGLWQGYSDFLERVDVASALGSFSYEAVDTKLKRKIDPKHALQLSLYSRALGEMQGLLPAQGHIELGNGMRASFQVEDVIFYAQRLAERLESFVANPWPTAPDPVSVCGLCRWREHCAKVWEEADSLVAVAGITRSQRQRLVNAGLTTLTALVQSRGAIKGLQPDILQKLRTQAQLQGERRAGGPPTFALRTPELGRGLSRIPSPNQGDLFFDMEGDPLIDGGREYLFGVYHETNGTPKFQTWWAHNQTEEKTATIDVLQFFTDHFIRYPDAYIFHYNHYEVTALKRLASKYGVAETQLDHLLRAQKFVDLYRVVQQAIIVSEPGYSIKNLEAFYMEKRGGEVVSAGASIIAYETWLETQDPKILQDIADYNEVDCQSTKLLRDWLVASVRPADTPWFTPTISENSTPAELPERAALRTRIQGIRHKIGDQLADLIFELNGFIKRADKPDWWEYFDRQEKETFELIDDLDCIGGLVATAPAVGTTRRYTYPPQQTKVNERTRGAMRGRPGQLTIVAMDRGKRQVEVKFPKAIIPPEVFDLVPGTPIARKVIQDGISRATETLIESAFQGSAIADFLNRVPPRLRHRRLGEPIIQGSDVVTGAVEAVRSLTSGCLAIQGPPGTGKTYVSSKAILDLVRSGKRVAVLSNSHKAIDNLLGAIAERAREAKTTVEIANKVSEPDRAIQDPMVRNVVGNDDAALMSASVVGGTAWLFARSEFTGSFNHLFIDEAGQVSVAYLLGCAACADNIVLVGDQMQLSQPTKGVHPGDSAMSTLDYLLAGQHTAAAEQGVFLPVSRRMHPDVCQIVSKIVYGGHLTSDAGAARQTLRFAAKTDMPLSGIAFFDVNHEGNGQESEEEATQLLLIYNQLLAAFFTDRDGVERPMTIDDILVISPYNAQVNLLKSRLPDGARVGTIDLFQGQEAPVCLISFATSSGAELPRDIEFLFSLNRLNVAISRAQVLAGIISSPRLLDVSCNTLAELELVNALCELKAYAALRHRET